MKVVTTVCMTRGVWNNIKHEEWDGFYFMEQVLDWSLYKGCKGKLYVESMEAEIPKGPERDAIMEGGWLRLSYQYLPAKQIPVEGSEIKAHRTFGARWTLQESGWFDLPSTPGVACLWIQGKAAPGKQISIALANLTIVEPEPGDDFSEKPSYE